MNDFTKEELRVLLRLIIWGDNEPYPTTDGVKSIEKKISFMIDNYCDHEHQEEIRETMCCGKQLFYAAVNWSIAKCGKCGRKLNDN